MNGDDIVRARKVLGWTRPELVELVNREGCPITVAQLARAERTGPRPDEEAALRVVLKDALGSVAVNGTPQPVPEKPHLQMVKGGKTDKLRAAGATVLEDWEGFQVGDPVKEVGAKGRAHLTFLRHVEEPGAKPYVECKDTRRGFVRTLTPDKIVPKKKVRQ